jgi:hypothetical protein
MCLLFYYAQGKKRHLPFHGLKRLAQSERRLCHRFCTAEIGIPAFAYWCGMVMEK